MFGSCADFLKTWEYETRATEQLLEQITDETLSVGVGSPNRTLGETAWHLATSPASIMQKAGIEFPGVDPKAPLPDHAANVADTYRLNAAQIADWIRARWGDQTLETVDDIYGEQWPRGYTLQILLLHQAHHRGQLTVLMRKAGLAVPGVYGPSRDG